MYHSKRRIEVQRLMHDARRALRGLLRDARGTVAIVTVASMPILAGFAGLAVDATYWYMVRQGLQTAGDAAAIGAAYEMWKGNNAGALIEAQREAVRNGFDSSNGGVITVNRPPTSGLFVGDADSVEVIISQPLQLFFTAIFMSGPLTTQVRAVARTVKRHGGQACLLGLDGLRAKTVEFSGGPIVRIDCGAASNSNDDGGMYASAIATLSANPFLVTGDVTVAGPNCVGKCGVGSPFSPLPLSGQPRQIDPYADLVAPSASACDFGVEIVGGTPKIVGTVKQNPSTLSPGVYCGGLEINTPAAIVNFKPGVYIIDGGDLRFSSGIITGVGVSIVLTGSAGNGFTNVDIGNFHVDGGVEVDLSAPTTDPMCPASVVAGTCPSLAGVLVYQDRNVPSGGNTLTNNKVLGGSLAEWGGALYFPNQNLEFTGGTEDKSGCTQIIARTIKISGNADLEHKCENTGIRPIDLLVRRPALVE